MEDIHVQVKKVDVMPLVKHYIEQLNLFSIFQKHMPKAPNSDIEPAQVLCTLIMNIICASKPFYQVEEWASEYFDGVAEAPVNGKAYNDDRLGRTMDLLFTKDRGTMMTELSANAIRVHNLETDAIRNDSTSITFTGAYNNKESEAVLLTQGFNKDHRPDCKQIVFGLNVTDDGYVPISYDIFDGNTTDDTTHIPNWDGLREFLSKEDFLYIADCKLCTADNLSYIAKSGGLFITILPRNRKEVKTFYQYLEDNDNVVWQMAYKEESSRKKGDFVIYQTYEGEKHHEGYRIIWVLSSAKKEQDRKRRDHKLEKIFKKLADLESKLNRYYLKTREQIESAINDICKGSKSLLNIDIIEEKEVEVVQVGRGKPGPNTKYKEKEKILYRIVYSRNEDAIAKKARTDGIFPLITNTEFSAGKVLQKYKEQPYLEKRMNTTKSILEVAPVYLKLPERIEALMFLYFSSLMIVSLIERRIRRNFEAEKIEKLPILPQGMNTKKPTWNNIKYYFRNVHLTIVKQGNKVLQASVKGMTDLHCFVVKLLEVPNQKYLHIKDGWWEFAAG